MTSYIIKRLIMIIPILIGVTFFLFMLLTLTPGDPAQIALGSGATEEQLDLFREQNGLNDPTIIQYFNYMRKAVIGDLGISYNTRQSVSTMIAVRVGNTLFLSFSSMFLTIIVALFLGIAMAIKQNSFFDNFMRVITVIFTSMPQFWLALMMILLVSVKLGWLPSTGLFTSPGDWVMPIICLSFQGITLCARTGRSSMLEVINQDYIRTARAKGLKRNYIIRRHALKNSLLPMVTVYGRIIASCFSGSVIIENIFGIAGIGQMMTNALRQKDVPAILGSIIISTCVITVVNLLTDIAYAFIDPRIKSQYVRRKNKVESESADEEMMDAEEKTRLASVSIPGAPILAIEYPLAQPVTEAPTYQEEVPPIEALAGENLYSLPHAAPHADKTNEAVSSLKGPDNSVSLERISHQSKKRQGKSHSLWGDVWKRLRKNKTAVIGIAVFVFILVSCLISSLYYNYENDIIAVNTSIQLQGPSREHIFGVDELGRDILARLLWGGQTTLLISISALAVAFICGTIIGTAAAYYGRFADTLIMRIIDVIMAIPPILLMITLATIMRPNTINLILVVGLGLMPGLSRMVRGQVLQVVDNEFIEAVRIQGASNLKIIVSHILPNALSPIITTVILDIAGAVMVISMLSFLGLGVQAPNPEWGAMLAGGRQYLRYTWHITTIPGIALVITLMSLTLVGDGLRDAMDPRMKR